MLATLILSIVTVSRATAAEVLSSVIARVEESVPERVTAVSYTHLTLPTKA